MKASMIYNIYKVLKAIWQFICDWWMLILLGIIIFVLTKIDEVI